VKLTKVTDQFIMPEALESEAKGDERKNRKDQEKRYSVSTCARSCFSDFNNRRLLAVMNSGLIQVQEEL
jgi:hypothetical protein